MVRRRSDSDESLAAASGAGDDSAFNELMTRYRDRIFTLCLRMTGVPDEADDCAQESFVKAYRALPSFRGESAFYTWLYRIAYRTCLDHLRSRKRGLLRSYFSGEEGCAGIADCREDPA
ncbi:MAG: RNA polymerase sigma factor, partial [Spirochaetota bacterium]